MGVTEANLKIGASIEDVEIKGYKLIWDMGRENPAKRNDRVVVYIKEELSFDIMKKTHGGKSNARSMDTTWTFWNNKKHK